MNCRSTRSNLVAAACFTLVLAGACILPGAARAGDTEGARRTPLTSLGAGRRDGWSIRFRGGETARVVAVGTGDIDLEIRDESGRLIESDLLDDSTPVCIWTPKWTGRFEVTVINAEDRRVSYILSTN